MKGVEGADLAGKITGMLLEGLDNSELVTLIDYQVALQSKIEEALSALQTHKEEHVTEHESLAALPPDEPLAKLKKTLDDIRRLHTKYKNREFLPYQTNVEQIMFEWLSITNMFLNADELRKAKVEYLQITQISNLFTRIMDIHDISDVVRMHAILAESQPALKVSFNRPRPSLSRPAEPAGPAGPGVKVVVIISFFERHIDGCLREYVIPKEGTARRGAGETAGADARSSEGTSGSRGYCQESSD
jgi:hypothetical protein